MADDVSTPLPIGEALPNLIGAAFVVFFTTLGAAGFAFGVLLLATFLAFRASRRAFSASAAASCLASFVF